MPKKNSTRTGRGTKQSKNRRDRKTFAITQKGIRNDGDLSAFFGAALSDIDAGRSDLEEMRQMTHVTRQIIALESLRLKAKVMRAKGQNKNSFLLSGETEREKAIQ